PDPPPFPYTTLFRSRDNPHAGGAEIHLHEIFGRLARRGHAVDLVASGWRGAAPHAELDCMRVFRTGGRHSFALRGRPRSAKLWRDRKSTRLNSSHDQ